MPLENATKTHAISPKGHPTMTQLFQIIRIHKKSLRRAVVLRSLTEAEADRYLKSSYADSSTCTHQNGKRATSKYGAWICEKRPQVVPVQPEHAGSFLYGPTGGSLPPAGLPNAKRIKPVSPYNQLPADVPEKKLKRAPWLPQD